MTNNTARPPKTAAYYGKGQNPFSDYSEEIALEQCFDRLAAVQQQGILQKLQQMSAALAVLSEELTQFLNTCGGCKARYDGF